MDFYLDAWDVPEDFNEAEHGLIDILIAWAELKPLLHTELFWA